MKLAVLQQRRRARRGKRASRALGRRGGLQGANAALSASRTGGDPRAAQAAPGGQHGAACAAQVRRYDHLRLSERVLLKQGARIRVSAGPYYEDRDGDGNVVKTKMAERGVMTFEEYCELNESRWIVARGKAGYAALHMGLQERSELLPGLVRRPYKIRKVRPRKISRVRSH